MRMLMSRVPMTPSGQEAASRARGELPRPGIRRDHGDPAFGPALNPGAGAGLARSWPGAAAGLLVLAALLALPLQAQAQSTDPVWSTTMTVGQASGDERGYSPDFGAGALGTDEFTASGADYDVRHLVVGSLDGAELWINPTLADKDNYILEVAGAELPLDSTTSTSRWWLSRLYWLPAWLASNATALDADNYRNHAADRRHGPGVPAYRRRRSVR